MDRFGRSPASAARAASRHAVTRRAALGIGAAAAGDLLLGRVRRAPRPPDRVIVIGAGLAGLACGLALREQGCEVTVLEARLRAGGRVRTVREFADGLYAEAGAARIPGDHALTMAYARRYGLELAPFYPPGLTGLPFADPSLMRIEGGNDRLPLAMAEDLAGQIRYGCAVKRIEHDDGMVRAVFERGEATETAEADRLVCTVPFSVLRTIEIEPPLSDWKRDAVESLGYESLTRASLQVRRRFWEDRGLTGFGTTRAQSEIWHATWHQPGERAVVQAYMKLDLSRKVTGESDEGRRSAATREIEEALPGFGELAEGCVCTCWDEDPWSLGATCAYTPVQQLVMLPRAKRQDGLIHFAGEHASDWQGWMQGALASGERVAQEVLAG